MKNGKIASCIIPVTARTPFLTGEGVLVAVIDSGIDYSHMDFRNKDGTTRIVKLWDQTIDPNPKKGLYPPLGFLIGTEFNQGKINEALRQPTKQQQLKIVPSRDISGHGTAVTGIAAGNGNGSDGVFVGVAPKSQLLIVKLGNSKEGGFPKTTELMRALDYVVKEAVKLGKSVAINLSFGNTYGAHDGTSLLERYINNISEIGRNVISIGSGNEAAAAGHASGQLTMEEDMIVELAVAPYELTTNIQIWKRYEDEIELSIIAPNGEEISLDLEISGTERRIIEGTEILAYIGEPTPYSTNQEIFIELLPRNTYIDQGVWQFVLKPIRIVTGSYSFYLPSAVVRNTSTKFFLPSPLATLTIPSTAGKVITVGAYNSVFNSYADFSGRGFGEYRDWKPTLVAPGVNITSTSNSGDYGEFTGTSFATPFVTGASALMMEWGIVKKNDTYLYGEKVKAYLIKGARQLSGYEEWPNPQVGYGALCLKESLPLR